MQLAVNHSTTYRFDGPAGALQELRLTPRAGAGQRIVEWSIDVDGGQHEVEFDDHHANRVHLVSLDPDTVELTLRSSGIVETSDTNGVIKGPRGHAPLWLYRRSTQLTEAGSLGGELLEGFEATADPVESMHLLSGHVLDAIAYEPGVTDATTTAEAALAAGRGVCQDHSHVFLAAARELGMSARYVSGYLHMPDRDDQDATHAWCEVWIADLGWVGFDVVNGISPDERYVRVAIGLDYREAAPISGLRFGDAGETLDVSLHVQQ